MNQQKIEAEEVSLLTGHQEIGKRQGCSFAPPKLGWEAGRAVERFAGLHAK